LDWYGSCWTQFGLFWTSFKYTHNRTVTGDVQVQYSFTSTETIKTTRDREPRTAISTRPQLLSSDLVISSSVYLYLLLQTTIFRSRFGELLPLPFYPQGDFAIVSFSQLSGLNFIGFHQFCSQQPETEQVQSDHAESTLKGVN